MCSYEQEEESEEHHDVGETNSICVLDADGILLGSALPLRDHWLSLNIKKGREKAIVSYYSSFVVLSLSTFDEVFMATLTSFTTKQEAGQQKFFCFPGICYKK